MSRKPAPLNYAAVIPGQHRVARKRRAPVSARDYSPSDPPFPPTDSPAVVSPDYSQVSSPEAFPTSTRVEAATSRRDFFDSDTETEDTIDLVHESPRRQPQMKASGGAPADRQPLKKKKAVRKPAAFVGLWGLPAVRPHHHAQLQAKRPGRNLGDTVSVYDLADSITERVFSDLQAGQVPTIAHVTRITQAATTQGKGVNRQRLAQWLIRNLYEQMDPLTVAHRAQLLVTLLKEARLKRITDASSTDPLIQMGRALTQEAAGFLQRKITVHAKMMAQQHQRNKMTLERLKYYAMCLP
jgi:hypothetical protein